MLKSVVGTEEHDGNITFKNLSKEGLSAGTHGWFYGP